MTKSIPVIPFRKALSKPITGRSFSILHLAAKRMAMVGPIVYDESSDFTNNDEAVKEFVTKRNGGNVAGTFVALPNGRNVLLQVGDEIDYNPLLTDQACKKNPTTSFLCIARLMSKNTPEPEPLQRMLEQQRSATKNILKIAKAFNSGRLKLIDYLPDNRIPFTDVEKRQVTHNQVVGNSATYFGLKVPRGYTPMRNYYHRSSSSLVQYGKKMFLLGQDEGTFFGVELPKQVKTVKAAYAALIPSEVKRNYKRQGEWFLAPIKKSELPPFSPQECEFQNIILPRETPEGKPHELSAIKGFIANKRIYAFDPVLSHPDHNEISLKGWVTFYKNTAVRSVSVEGVD